MSDSIALPREIWGEVFSCFQSRKDLCGAALVCRSWRLEAERFIYRSVDIFRLRSDWVKGLLYHVIGRQPIASHIRKLVMMIKPELTDAVHGILLVVHNLKWLTLRNRGDSTFNPYLSPTGITFALQVLKTDYRLDQGILSFIRSQPTILLLSWVPEEAFSPLHVLSQSDVPNVRAIALRNSLGHVRARQQVIIPSVRSINIRIDYFDTEQDPHIHIKALRSGNNLGVRMAKVWASMFPNITYFSLPTQLMSQSFDFTNLTGFHHLRKIQFFASTSGQWYDPLREPKEFIDQGLSTLETVDMVNYDTSNINMPPAEVTIYRFLRDDLGQFSKMSVHRGDYDTVRLEWATWDN